MTPLKCCYLTLGIIGQSKLALLISPEAPNAAMALPLLTCARVSWNIQVNEFCKRVRALRIHMLIVGHLRKQMPALMGKKAAQDRLLRNLAEEFGHVQREHHLPPGALTQHLLLTVTWRWRECRVQPGDLHAVPESASGSGRGG